MDEIKKKVDESWKDAVEKEKKEKGDDSSFGPPEPSFGFFVTTLAIQASIFLGVLENPATNKKEENLSQAKFIIDTLDMLKTKTAGNLNQEEANVLDNVLYELKMTYVSKITGGKKE